MSDCDKNEVYPSKMVKMSEFRHIFSRATLWVDIAILYYAGFDMFSFTSKQYKFEEVEMSADGKAYYTERSIEEIAECFLYD
jgi:hypothetical protein